MGDAVLTGFSPALLLLPLIAAVFFTVYMNTRRIGRIKALYKCVPSFLAFFAALPAALRPVDPALAGWLVAGGLLLCALADWTLEFRFVRGMALFGSAHVLFIIAFAQRGRIDFWAVLSFVLLFRAASAFFRFFRDRKPPELPFAALYVYAGVLSLMASLSLGCNVLTVAGAFLFLVSDGLLCFRLFGFLREKKYSWLLMGAYYAALFLIAFGSG